MLQVKNKRVIFAYMKRTLVTVTEFARMNDVSRDTIYKWIKNDKLPKGSILKKVAGRNFISVPHIARVWFKGEMMELK